MIVDKIVMAIWKAGDGNQNGWEWKMDKQLMDKSMIGTFDAHFDGKGDGSLKQKGNWGILSFSQNSPMYLDMWIVASQFNGVLQVSPKKC